jgi:hypothetical protein
MEDAPDINAAVQNEDLPWHALLTRTKEDKYS